MRSKSVPHCMNVSYRGKAEGKKLLSSYGRLRDMSLEQFQPCTYTYENHIKVVDLALLIYRIKERNTAFGRPRNIEKLR